MLAVTRCHLQLSSEGYHRWCLAGEGWSIQVETNLVLPTTIPQGAWKEQSLDRAPLHEMLAGSQATHVHYDGHLLHFRSAANEGEDDASWTELAIGGPYLEYVLQLLRLIAPRRPLSPAEIPSAPPGFRLQFEVMMA